MNKTDLIKELASADMETCALTQDQAKDIINTTLAIITRGLKKDGSVQITGFGTFNCTHVPEREGHNPKNPAEKIKIAARNQVSFSSGAQLKEDVNK